MIQIDYTTMYVQKCICCDELTQKWVTLHKTRRQNHILCIDCSNGYIKPLINKIKSKMCEKNHPIVYTIQCPGTYKGNARNQCKCNVNIRNILLDNDTDLYTDIFRIIYVLDNPSLRICPNKYCGNIVDTTHTCAHCTNCNTKWCKWCHCIPYHDNMNCIEYEVKTSSSDNNTLILDLYNQGKLKFCPQCNASTTKEKDNNGDDVGCNKMYCTGCGITWCWLCSTANIDYTHFNSFGTGSCANRLWEGTNVA